MEQRLTDEEDPSSPLPKSMTSSLSPQPAGSTPGSPELCSTGAERKPSRGEAGLVCEMQLECGFGCSGSEAEPGGKAAPCRLGPHCRLSRQHSRAEPLRGWVCKAWLLLKTADLLRSRIQYLPLLQLFYI